MRFFSQTFLANSDDHSISTQELNPEIDARYVRLTPVTWYNHVCMKVELFGYKGMSIINLSKGLSCISDKHINVLTLKLIQESPFVK